MSAETYYPDGREQELEMMRDPLRWPHRNMLPLVKRYRDVPGKFPDTAFLYCSPMTTTVEPVLYMENMWGELKDKDIPYKQYPSFEAIIDDGWEVD